MNKLRLAVFSVAGICLLATFQNCGSTKFSSPGADSESSVAGQSVDTPSAASTGSNAGSVAGAAASSAGSSVGAAGGSSTGSSGSSSTVSNGGSPANPGGSVPPSNPVTTSGGTVFSHGQSLTFRNNSGLASGNATVLDASSDIVVQLMDPLAGRIATVKIIVDPVSHAFSSVQLVSANPYMCHDPNAPVCQQFPNLTSGAPEDNCHSAINYIGSLTGSIWGLAGTGADTNCH